MAQIFEGLRPYKSMLLTQASAENKELGVNLVLDGLTQALEINVGGGRHLKHRENESVHGSFTAGFIHFQDRRRAPWTMDNSIVNITEHLALVCRKGENFVFCWSNSDLRNQVRVALGKP